MLVGSASLGERAAGIHPSLFESARDTSGEVIGDSSRLALRSTSTDGYVLKTLIIAYNPKMQQFSFASYPISSFSVHYSP